MAKQGWILSEITQAHLHDLVSLGFMTTAELMSCRVPKDNASPMPVEGYVVAFAAFYEQGFSVSSH
jgi:hypothetical protein